MDSLWKTLNPKDLASKSYTQLINYVEEYKDGLIDPKYLTIAGVTGAAIAYSIYHFRFNYWSSRGVNGPTPIPIVGNFMIDLLMDAKDNDNFRVQKYGKVFGGYVPGPIPILYVMEADLLKEIIISKFSYFSGKQNISGHEVSKNFLTAKNGADWKRMRSIISPTFSSGKMKAMMPLMNQCYESLDRAIERNSGGIFDTKQLFGNFTMDVIAKCAFATEINSHEEESAIGTAAKEFFNFKKSKIFLMFIMPRFMIRWLQLQGSSSEHFEYLVNVCKTIMKQREASPDIANLRSYTDYMQLLLNAKGNDNMSENEFLAAAIIVLVAGYETTATLLTYASYCLAMNPDKQELLLKEIDAAGDLDYDTIFRMKYLDCVISETLRAYPPVIRVERKVTEKVTLSNGLTLDPGVLVRFPIYQIHHDPDYFPEPDKFLPERFSDENKDSILPCTWLPFVDGPRNCVGKRFAEMEAKLALSRILKNYKFVKCSDTEKPIQFKKGSILLTPQNIRVVIQKR